MDIQANFGGEYALGWNTLNTNVIRPFMEANPQGNDHRLTVNWCYSSPEDDPDRTLGGATFRLLFSRLSEDLAPGRSALSAFERISITVSELFDELDCPVKFTGARRSPAEQSRIDNVKIDLISAVNLSELILKGSHLYLSERFSNIPFHRLTLLSVSSSNRISVDDTLVLLHSCPLLKNATFGVVDTADACELYSRFRELPAGANFTCKLRQLTITSHVDVSRILTSVRWENIPTITLNILDNAVARQDWGPCLADIPVSTQLTMIGSFPQATMAKILRRVPAAVFRRA